MSAKKTASRSERRLPRAPRGQAMIEYSLVTHFLLIGGSLALMPVMSILFNSVTKFYESIYLVLMTAAV